MKLEGGDGDLDVFNISSKAGNCGVVFGDGELGGVGDDASSIVFNVSAKGVREGVGDLDILVTCFNIVSMSGDCVVAIEGGEGDGFSHVIFWVDDRSVGISSGPLGGSSFHFISSNEGALVGLGIYRPCSSVLLITTTFLDESRCSTQFIRLLSMFQCNLQDISCSYK